MGAISDPDHNNLIQGYSFSTIKALLCARHCAKYHGTHKDEFFNLESHWSRKNCISLQMTDIRPNEKYHGKTSNRSSQQTNNKIDPMKNKQSSLFGEKSFSSNLMYSLPAAAKSTYNIYHEYNAHHESKCYLFKLFPR